VALGVIAALRPISGVPGLVLIVALGITALAILRAVSLRVRRAAVWPLELDEALGLYRAGDLAAAAARLDALLAGPRLHPAYRAAALAWRAQVALRQSDAAWAVVLWAEVMRSGHWRAAGLRRVLAGVPGMLALAAAAEGDLARARRWLTQLPVLDAQWGMGARLLATVYLALREGDRPAARRLAREGWPMACATLAPAELRALRTLAALAEPDPDGPAARTWREGARPGWPGELDYLARGWPALTTLLRASDPPGRAVP